jgi:transcriptional regulator PpsR
LDSTIDPLIGPASPAASVNVAQPDVTLLLDLAGVIREVTFSGVIPGEDAAPWLGKPWTDTVLDSGTDKVNRMIEHARLTGLSAFRQLTQRFPSGLELPMEYTTVLLGGRAGLLAIGKNLQAVAELQSRLIAAQQTMEKDYWKLRDIETRYRMLFDASSEAVLLIRAANMRIEEANPAAVRTLDPSLRSRDGIAGRDFLQELQPQEREAFRAMVHRVRESGKAPGMIVHLGKSSAAFTARACHIASEPGPSLLLQLSPVDTRLITAKVDAVISSDELVECVPDGFIAVDANGTIRFVNQAFLDLVQVGSKASVLGEPLARWLWRPGADVTVLLTHVHRNRFVRLFSSTVHSELGASTDVEISAAVLPQSASRMVGIVLRDVSRRLTGSTDDDRLRAALGSMTEQVGKTPLRKLVRDTVTVVEKHYVKAAIELANGNRTAAAEILGLSRQSLYSKLDRYGLGGEPEASDVNAD